MNLTFEYSLSIPYLILDWPKQTILQGDELKLRLESNTSAHCLERQLGIKVTPQGILIATDYFASVGNCLKHFQQLFHFLKKNLLQINLTPIAISAHPDIAFIQRPCFSLKHNYLWRDRHVRDELSQRFFAYAPALSTLSSCGWLKNFDTLPTDTPIATFKSGHDDVWELHTEFFDTATGIHEYQSYFYIILELLQRKDLTKKDNEQNAKLRMANNYQSLFSNEFNSLLLNDFFKQKPIMACPSRLLYDRWIMQRNPALEIRERFINSNRSLHPLYWEKCILTVA
jgi:hypothetical protein